MYKAFYSLSREPFVKGLKTADSFVSAAFAEARARLDYLKKVKGMGLLVGEPGAGKTFTLRAFADSLNPSLYKVIYFPLSTGTVMDFFRGLVTGLGEEPKFRKVDLFHQIQKAVLTFYQERKITPVFILDEMQLAKDLFLHDLSIIFNFGMDSENPFILVISGLPYMQDKLSLNHNRPLSQRLVMRYKIEPLNKDEVAGYIRHYMSLAGAKHDVFSDVALEAIASHSRGWPRLVNNLATHCLLCGYQAKKELIDEEVVRLAIQEMGL
ncbi:AAA ATPase [Desulfotomaculum nigrificans CO-1-SRB]|uniref:AAA ATPase n=1 Tax=Desulfotomaculum nigrificans (strain DSM 14880 / VKM B-2319 / CO-1-SRB) TaxID=868595 RepID=F6B746_DESCC|nr:AAA family ATPase [Desulfotomaculum nigrificans]AEF94471.1 AAA ATPase [Desulfotomaculum nigrificans CO-1-SRB]